MSIMKKKLTQFYKNISIRKKINILMGSVLALLIAVMGMYWYTVSFSTRGFDKLIKEDTDLAKKAQTIKSQILETINEIDKFLLTPEDSIISEIKNNIESLTNTTTEVSEIANRTGYSEEAKQLHEIKALVGEFLSSFNSVAAAVKTKGYTRNTGLQSQFRVISVSMVSEIKQFLGEASNPQIADLLLAIRDYEKDYLLYNDQTDVSRMHQAIAELISTFKESDVPEDTTTAIEDALSTYKNVFDAVVKIDRDTLVLTKKMTDVRQKIMDAVPAIVTSLTEKKLLKTDALLMDARQFSNIALGIGIIAIIIGLGAFILAPTIMKPLENVIEKAEKIETGNLNVTFDSSSQDETGWLAYTMQNMVSALKNKVTLAEKIADGDLSIQVDVASEKDILGLALRKMVDNLNIIVNKISNHSDTLHETADQLSAVSGQISNATTEMSSQSGTVAGAANEMTTSITTMAAGSEQMNTSIQSISATSTQMSHNMTDISKSMEQLSGVIGNVTDKSKAALTVSNNAKEMSETAQVVMSELGQSANDIGEVAEIIKEIAQQTNLLALNANIEAASAGEAGKGFAVVANEIKELARQSSSSAETIEKKIKDIQKNSVKSNQSMEDIMDIIKVISNSSGEIKEFAVDGSDSLDGMVRNVKESATGVAEIAKTISEMSNTSNEFARSSRELISGSNEISKNMGELNLVVSNTTSEISEVSNEAIRLTGLSEELKQLVEQFKLKSV